VGERGLRSVAVLDWSVADGGSGEESTVCTCRDSLELQSYRLSQAQVAFMHDVHPSCADAQSNYGGVCGTVVGGCLNCRVSSGLGGAIPIQN
jgi:hypothetical protein